MTNRILKITDGTSTVNLLNLEDGYSVDGWRQQVAQYKGGGSWSESALSDGRQLVDYRYGNVPEVIPLDVSGGVQENVIAALRDLQALLTKAADYWRYEWQTGPVWLEKRAACEQNTSYAIIYTGNMPDVADVFGRPFESGPVLDDLQITIERGQWLTTAPGTGTQEALAQFQTYNGENFGNTDDTLSRLREETTDLDRVYIANKNNIAQFTHVWVYDAAPAPGYTNMIGSSLPYWLFPTTPAIGDMLYLGIDTTVTDSGPFCSAIFDLANGEVNLTLQWEYYSSVGPGWAVIPAASMLDGTDNGGGPLSTTGVCGLYFRPDSTWVAFNVNGTTAYWIRCVITNVIPAGINPRQQNCDPYTVTWGSIPIEEDDITGDMPALLKLFLHVRSSALLPSYDPELSAHRFIVGLRSDSRGTNFSAYLNAANEQNPTGVTVAEFTPGIFVADPRAPNGWVSQYASAGAGTQGMTYWTFTTAATAAAYHGVYRVFARVHQSTGSAGQAGLRLSYFTGTQRHVYRQSADVYTQSTAVYELLDMGVVAMPGRYPPGVDSYHGILATGLYTAAATLNIHDLIFIPVDEWAADIRAPDATDMTTAGYVGYPIHLDSLSVPKHFIHARQVNTSDVLQAWWTPVANGQAILQPTTGQKLWVLAINTPDGTTYEVAPIPITSTVGVYHNQRFLIPRGNA